MESENMKTAVNKSSKERFSMPKIFDFWGVMSSGCVPWMMVPETLTWTETEQKSLFLF